MSKIVDGGHKNGDGESSSPIEQRIALLNYARKTLNLYISYKEMECIKFLMMGYSDNDIAQRIDTSPIVVQYYVQSLLFKCGCSDRARLREYLCEKLKL